MKVEGEHARPRCPNIDVGLAVICAVTPKATCWALRDIAEVCGCTFQAIQRIEKKALTKMRTRIRTLKLEDDLKGAFGP